MKKNKVIIITGVTGQDGSLMADYLLKNTEHIAIYLGDDLILHQPRGRESLIEKYSEALKRRKSYIIRHKKLAWKKD